MAYSRRVMALLTKREREVLALAIEGLVNKEIAAQLGISPRTVESHWRNIYHKLGVRSKVEAIAKVLGAEEGEVRT